MKTKNRKKKKKDIIYGDVDFPGLEEIDSKEVKVRVTTWLDEDVLLALREQAASVGKGYQTILNSYLREIVLKEKPSIESRLAKLEKAVFKKRA